MAHIGQLLLACGSKYIVNEGRKVLQAQLLLAEVPILGLTRIERRVVLSVPCASVVRQPDIVTLARQDKRRRQVRIIGGPKVHIAFIPMHEKDGRFIALR